MQDAEKLKITGLYIGIINFYDTKIPAVVTRTPDRAIKVVEFEIVHD